MAALLHDISKIQAFYNVRQAPQMIRHDTRTLEILAGPMAVLESKWRDGADLLRICLELPLVRQEFLKRKTQIPVIAEMVAHADQYSTASYKERRAFSVSKKWQRVVKYDDIIYLQCHPD